MTKFIKAKMKKKERLTNINKQMLITNAFNVQHYLQVWIKILYKSQNTQDVWYGHTYN